MKKRNGLAAGMSVALACLMVVSPSELFAAKHKKAWSKFSQGLLGQPEETQGNGGQDAEKSNGTFDLFGRKNHRRQRQQNVQRQENVQAYANVDLEHMDDAELSQHALQLARSDKAAALDVAKRIKDNKKLSEAVVAKAKEAYDLQNSIVSKEQVGGYRDNPNKFNSDIDELERLYNSFAALAPLARDMESVGRFCGNYDVQRTKGKEGRYDFFTPFEQGMREAFMASLTDNDRTAAKHNYNMVDVELDFRC